jgi:hypothetical protein
MRTNWLNFVAGNKMLNLELHHATALNFLFKKFLRLHGFAGKLFKVMLPITKFVEFHEVLTIFE